jgi:two-component system, NtrC family, response regulator HydG
MIEQIKSDSKAKILIIDDEAVNLGLLVNLLKGHYEVYATRSGVEALQLLETGILPDLILLDIVMPDLNGYDVCKQLKAEPATYNIPIIFITSKNSGDDEFIGFESGAVDYITKPFSPQVVMARIKLHLTQFEMIKQALELKSLRKQLNNMNDRVQSQGLSNPGAFKNMVSNHQSMNRIFHKMEAFSDSGEPILINGETGVGKELIAKAMHTLNNRPGRLVSVNMAGLDDNAFTDTLFGHKRGAYTGADQSRKGLISEAEGGTLFLDEIGDLALSSQVKLLRLLQEGVFFPLGSDQPTKADVFILAATNRDLNQEVENGSFRKDLFYRLNTHQITVPPLRERKEDIIPLTKYFLKEAFTTMNRPIAEPTPELITLLNLYHFPGNVRELRALLYNAAALHKKGHFLSMESIREAIGKYHPQIQVESDRVQDDKIIFNLKDGDQFPTLDHIEEQLIKEALCRAEDNQGLAASLLGISRHALNRRLQGRLKHLKPISATPSLHLKI